MLKKELYLISIVAVVIAVAVVAVVVLLPDDGNDPGPAPGEEVTVSFAYTNPENSTAESPEYVEYVTGTNFKNVLTKAMSELGHTVAFDSGGKVSSVDGEKAPEGKEWMMWQWDIKWTIIPNVNDSQSIDWKDKAAFGLCLTEPAYNDQKYISPAYYTNVWIDLDGGDGKYYKTSESDLEDMITDVLDQAGHTVEFTSDGKIKSISGITNECVAVMETITSKVDQDPDTGMYTRDIYNVFSWSEIPDVGYDKFKVYDRMTIGVLDKTYFETKIMNVESKDLPKMAQFDSELPWAPEGEFHFFIMVTEAFTEQIYEDPEYAEWIPKGITREQLEEGFWIKGVESDGRYALVDAFESYGWDLILSSAIDQSGSDLRGWIFWFYGLYSNGIAVPGTSDWIYPAQFSWNNGTSVWDFNSWTLGYYSYMTTPTLGIIYTQAPNGCKWLGPESQTGETYEELTINIVFDSNGGTGTMSGIEMHINETEDLTKCSFTNSGKTFKGWSLSATGPVEYNDAGKLELTKEITKIESNDVVLYAVWE